ncbi:MAG: M23 family metallopeptidase [Treponema sp.]|nr:M23 family metallopeptidase [Treponema sp.]
MRLSKKILTKVIFLTALALNSSLLFAQNSIKIQKDKLPPLERLKTSRNNPIFEEYNRIVEDNYKTIKRNEEPEMLFFVHNFTQEDKADLHWSDSQLISLASRCNISYDTIATLNKIPSANDSLINKSIIIPTVSGLFIKRYADENANALEILLRENYADTNLTNNAYYYNIDGEEYIFLINRRFSSTERFYFLDSGLGLPLEKGSFWISSEFGKRKNPVSGEWKDHNGIDLAAAEGTPVYAVKDGYAAYCIEKDKTFGNYIILTHDTGKMSSVYAHLSSICINQYQFVRKGDIIGYVGQTGMATGSHLHFEIRQGGVAQDPRTKLDLK